MLWYKGWLETRYRILLVLGLSILFMFVIAHAVSSLPQPVARFTNPYLFYWPFVAVMLAGAGIQTQTEFRATKGLHGSMYFTLSLPVSRFRLLAVRAGLGMIETACVVAAVCCTSWAIFPGLRVHLTGLDALEYVVTVSICVSGFYFLSVLLATFLDDMWKLWGSLIVIFFLRWLSANASLPPSLDIFRAIGESSPLVTHTLPWASMGVSLGAAAILFLAALKVVQLREY